MWPVPVSSQGDVCFVFVYDEYSRRAGRFIIVLYYYMKAKLSADWLWVQQNKGTKKGTAAAAEIGRSW